MPHKDALARKNYAREWVRRHAPQRKANRAATRAVASSLDNACDPSVKTCRRCQQVKPVEMFGQKAKSPDGRNWWCKECNRSQRKLAYAADPEKQLEARRAYYAQNAEKEKEYKKRWFQENKVKIREGKREYLRAYRVKYAARLSEQKKAHYEANKDTYRAQKRIWQLQNKAKINSSIGKRRAAKKNATPLWLSDMNKWQIDIIYAVSVALTEMTGVLHSVDHIHPLQGDGFRGLHVPWNLRVVTARENSMKCNKLPPDEAYLSWNGV